jgi:hypothetical protein
MYAVGFNERFLYSSASHLFATRFKPTSHHFPKLNHNELVPEITQDLNLNQRFSFAASAPGAVVKCQTLYVRGSFGVFSYCQCQDPQYIHNGFKALFPLLSKFLFAMSRALGIAVAILTILRSYVSAQAPTCLPGYTAVS